MDNTIGNYLATGGVSGTIVCVFYFLYKCCYKKRIRSSCCGGSFDMKDSQSSSPTSKSEKGIQVVVPPT